MDDSSHPVLDDVNYHPIWDDSSHPVVDDVNYHPILDDSSHPLFELLDLAFKCRHNVDEMAWQIYTYITVLDYLHLACFAYAIQEREHKIWLYVCNMSFDPLQPGICLFVDL